MFRRTNRSRSGTRESSAAVDQSDDQDVGRLDKYSIDADELHRLLESKKDIVVVLDVRQPLDLLAHSEIIPGAVRVPPKEVMEQAALIPKDKDSVVYCTCVSEKTSRMVLHNALRLNFSRIRFL